VRVLGSFALIFGAALEAHAGSNSVYNFLRIDAGARAAALAGSFVSATNDPSLIFYNPAGLSTLDAPRGTTGFFKHILDINAGNLAYSQKLEDVGYVGAGIIYTNYGSFVETDDAGNELGNFTASDFAFMLSYANFFEENFSYGATIKFIYSAIDGYKSTGVAGDVGILYNIPESRIALGASVRNIGAQLSAYETTKESLPLDVTIGGSVIPRGLPLFLNVNFHRLTDDVPKFSDHFSAFSVGGEFTLSKVLQLRVGFDNTQRKDLKIGSTSGLAGFSAGFGINASRYKVDYAISSLGQIGALHRISISSTF
jgi:hypothetical protein